MRLLIALALTMAAVLAAPTLTGTGATPMAVWQDAGPLEQLKLRPSLPQLGRRAEIPLTDIDELPTNADIAQQISDVPLDLICTRLTDAAQSSGLPAPFFARLIWQESRFNARAVSPAGAQGVAQFMPRVASAMGLVNPFDPLAALPVSAELLRTHYRNFGNLGLAAAAYNAGPKRILDWLARRGKLPEETRNYVRIVTGQPPERWTVEQPIEISYKLPSRAPCHGIGGLSREAGTQTIPVQLESSVAKVIADARAAEERAKKIRAARALKAAKAANAAKAKAKEIAKKDAAPKKEAVSKGNSREKLMSRGKSQDPVHSRGDKVASAVR